MLGVIFLGLGYGIGFVSKRYWTAPTLAVLFALITLPHSRDLFQTLMIPLGAWAGGWLGAAMWWKHGKQRRLGVVACILAGLSGLVLDAAGHDVSRAVIGGAILVCTAVVGVGWALLQEDDRQEPPDVQNTKAPVA